MRDVEKVRGVKRHAAAAHVTSITLEHSVPRNEKRAK